MEDLCPGKSSRLECGNSRKASGSHYCVRVLLVQKQHTVPVSDVVAAVQMRGRQSHAGPLSGADGRALCSPTSVGRHHLHQETSFRHVGDAHRPDSKTTSAKKYFESRGEGHCASRASCIEPIGILDLPSESTPGGCRRAVRDDFRSPLPDVGE